MTRGIQREICRHFGRLYVAEVAFLLPGSVTLRLTRVQAERKAAFRVVLAQVAITLGVAAVAALTPSSNKQKFFPASPDASSSSSSSSSAVPSSSFSSSSSSSSSSALTSSSSLPFSYPNQDQKNVPAENRIFSLPKKFSPDLIYLDTSPPSTSSPTEFSTPLAARLDLLARQGWVVDERMYGLSPPTADEDHTAPLFESEPDMTVWYHLFTTPQAVSRMLGRRRDRQDHRTSATDVVVDTTSMTIRIPKARLKILDKSSNREAAKRFHDSQLTNRAISRGAWQTGGRNRDRGPKPIRNRGPFHLRLSFSCPFLSIYTFLFLLLSVKLLLQR